MLSLADTMHGLCKLVISCTAVLPCTAHHLVEQIMDAGSSSGLHHDFHDNLYLLLRGCKHFELYPPTMASLMYTNGTISKIHPNGRIVYEGQVRIICKQISGCFFHVPDAGRCCYQ